MTAAVDPSPPERAFLRFGSDDGLGHLPALDGLRGLAVAAVVAFHGNWPWARGGFLGVSLFFTLSGFLITSLLIHEFRRRQGIDLAGFWGRRFRRLLPAAWLTLAVVVIVTAGLGEFTSAARADVWGALANVANWRFWAAGSSYNDLFAQPSPVRHFWSLAIEEQCYVALPVVVGLALHLGRSRLRVLAGVLATLLAGSIAITLVASGTDRVYYGTDTRAAELLIGALLAVAVAHEPLRRRVALSLWPRWAVQIAGAVALGLTVAAWVALPVDDPLVSSGGLVLVGVLSAALVLSAAVGTGPVAELLAVRPLRFLGRISYGVYLFHWPLFVFLTERRTGLGHAPRFVVQVALALAAATISHRWFEQPLRRATGRLAPGRLAGLAPVVATAMILATVGVGTAGDRTVGFDAETAVKGLQQLNARAAVTTSSAPASASTTSPPAPSIAVFGDSVALSIAYPLNVWSLQTGSMNFIGGDAELGCGIGRGGEQRAFGETARTAECDGWPQRWSAFVGQHHPDIALVQSGQWELVDRRLPGDATWRHIGDPVYDGYLRGEFLAATDELAAAGAMVVWVTLPQYSRLDEDGLPEAMRASHDPARVDALNAVVREVAAARPDHVRVVDLAAWMADKTDDQSLRKDGSHFNDTGATRLPEEFLGPRLLDLWDDWRAARSGTGDG